MQEGVLKRPKLEGSSFPLELLFSHKPITTHLLRFLSPMSFFALWNISPAFFRICFNVIHITPSTFFQNTLSARLFETFQGNREVVEIIMTHLSVAAEKKRSLQLTGGYLLAVLTGDKIDPESDLDFIVKQHGVFNPLTLQLEKFGITVADPAAPLPMHYTGRMAPHLHSVWTFVLFGRKLQLMELTKGTAPITYINSYDFDFCKNAYGNGERLVLTNTESIYKRQTRVLLERTYFLPVLERASVTFMLNYLSKIYARIVKYRGRGYTINLVKASSEQLRTHDIPDAIRNIVDQRQTFTPFISVEFQKEATPKVRAHVRDASVMWQVHSLLEIWQWFWDDGKKINSP